MKPKLPEKCPYCGAKHGIALTHITSRVYAELECATCKGTWRADAATGRLIARLVVGAVPEIVDANS